jgi:hypothetical protein
LKTRRCDTGLEIVVAHSQVVSVQFENVQLRMTSVVRFLHATVERDFGLQLVDAMFFQL